MLMILMIRKDGKVTVDNVNDKSYEQEKQWRHYL